MSSATYFKLVGWLLISERMMEWAKTHYPPQTPEELPPTPGYKVFGFMGCQQSRVQAVSELSRNLFFANDIEVPQLYALRRTSMFSRMTGADHPVVLQIEIEKNSHIEPSELWRDTSLTRPITPQLSSFVSYWPAIPPEVQKRCGLKVRVHHVVSCSVQQQGGYLCRAIHDIWEKCIHKYSR